jgi:hypothetical protein
MAPPDAGTELFPEPGPELRRAMEALLPLIEKTFPIPGRFRRDLVPAVAELSRFLTSARGERSLSYLNRPPLLSAYLRYFLPWNLYRLCRLLPSLDLPLAPGDRILDLGAGPLTLPIGLWLCRPDLRGLPLEFRCLDRSRAALEAGKELFAALTGTGGLSGVLSGPGLPAVSRSPWTITTVCGEIDRPGGWRRGLQDKAALVAALNVYNEVFQPISPGDDGGLRRFADAQGALLASYTGGRILVVEPGTPRSGRFIALLREALIGLGRPPCSPCAHGGPCPFPGKGGFSRGVLSGDSGEYFPGPSPGKTASKWCHFAFDTQSAPAVLRRLSMAAGLPKERATLSFLLAGPAEDGTVPCPVSGDQTLSRAVIPGKARLPARRIGRSGTVSADRRDPFAGSFAGSTEGVPGNAQGIEAEIPQALPPNNRTRKRVDEPMRYGVAPTNAAARKKSGAALAAPVRVRGAEELERIARSGIRAADAGCAQIPNRSDPGISGEAVLVRVISDPFPVGQGEWGRYGCTEGGMALVRGGRGLIESLLPGGLIEAVSLGGRDSKSGAVLCCPVLRKGEAKGGHDGRANPLNPRPGS